MVSEAGGCRKRQTQKFASGSDYKVLTQPADMPQPYLDRRAASAWLFDVRRILEYGKVERLTSYISPYVPTAPILVKGRKKHNQSRGVFEKKVGQS